MTTTLQQRESASLWEQFCQWITSTNNRLYIARISHKEREWSV
jgi:photosystem II P680 reaction center D1 protein